jgi:hypothetical protein
MLSMEAGSPEPEEAGRMNSNDREKPGGNVDERTRRTLGKLLRDTYKDHVEAELPPKLTAMIDRLRSRSE